MFEHYPVVGDLVQIDNTVYSYQLDSTNNIPCWVEANPTYSISEDGLHIINIFPTPIELLVNPIIIYGDRVKLIDLSNLHDYSVLDQIPSTVVLDSIFMKIHSAHAQGNEQEVEKAFDVYRSLFVLSADYVIKNQSAVGKSELSNLLTRSVVANMNHQIIDKNIHHYKARQVGGFKYYDRINTPDEDIVLKKFRDAQTAEYRASLENKLLLESEMRRKPISIAQQVKHIKFVSGSVGTAIGGGQAISKWVDPDQGPVESLEFIARLATNEVFFYSLTTLSCVGAVLSGGTAPAIAVALLCCFFAAGYATDFMFDDLPLLINRLSQDSSADQKSFAVKSNISDQQMVAKALSNALDPIPHTGKFLRFCIPNIINNMKQNEIFMFQQDLINALQEIKGFSIDFDISSIMAINITNDIFFDVSNRNDNNLIINTKNESDTVIFGGKGHDVIVGGAGKDTVYGNDGYDKLYGGSGEDTYILDRHNGVRQGGDIITDPDGTGKIYIKNNTGQDVLLEGHGKAAPELGAGFYHDVNQPNISYRYMA